MNAYVKGGHTMKLVTVAQMRHLEQRSDAAGHDYAAMMERAGHAVAAAVRARIAPGAAVLVLVGPGNNGGDGLVAARYLAAWGFRAEVYIWRRGAGEEGLDPNLAIATELGIPIVHAAQDPDHARLVEQVRRCDAVVDALLGTGITGALRDDLAALLQVVRGELDRGREDRNDREASPVLRDPATPDPRAWRAPRPPVIAVDAPSGLDCDTGAIDARALRADVTVTFACPKRGQYLSPGAGHVGTLLVADIGIPGDVLAEFAREAFDEVADAELVRALLPRRPASAHKGTFGKALIVAGSSNYVGAACLAAQAACRAGAGLVTLAVPEAIHPMVASQVTEATYLVLPHDLGVLVPEALRVLEPHLGEYEALLVGPGIGRERPTAEFLAQLIAGRGGRRGIGFLPGDATGAPARGALPPLVVDADALNVLSGLEGWWEHLPAPAVLTPHPGEMARLTGMRIEEIQRDRMGVARDAARRWGQVVVLKGAHTVVSDGARLTIIPFANPALATAGTGDVLAGTIVALLAQGLAPYDAAVCGAYLHGLAAAFWPQRAARAGMVAGDLLPLLPQALAALA